MFVAALTAISRRMRRPRPLVKRAHEALDGDAKPSSLAIDRAAMSSPAERSRPAAAGGDELARQS